MREETRTDLYATAATSREYDEACKRIFRNKEIIAPIMQMVVPEYKNCTVEEVIRCIDSDTIEEIPVEDVPIKIEGLPTELSSVTEKLIRYDVHFKSVNPVLTDSRICVHLHIDLEVQNDYKPRNPAYPVIKRALYYAVRELSAQLGGLTETTDYSALEKVYSIWICNKNIPPELRDTATAYSIQKSDIIGACNEAEEDFDLLNVIMIRRGGNSRDKIFDFLSAVFDGEIKKMEQYTDIAENEALRQEVAHMSGLGASLLEEGIEQGIERGIEQGIEQATANFVKRMLEEGEPVEKIMMYSGCTKEDVLQIKKQEEEEMQAEDIQERRRPERRR